MERDKSSENPIFSACFGKSDFFRIFAESNLVQIM